MSILDREILRRWIKPTLISLTVCLILFLITDLFGLTESFVEQNPPLLILLSYIGYRVGFFLFYLIPLAVLVGGYWGLNGWRRSNEWTAVLTSGVHPLRLLRGPLVLLGVLTLGMTVYGVQVLPAITDRANLLRNQKIKGHQQQNPVHRNLHFILDRNRTLKVQRFYPGGGRFEGVVVTRKTENRIVEKLSAKEGTYSDKEGWILHDVEMITFNPTGEIKHETTVDTRSLELESPATLRNVVQANPRRIDSDPARFRLHELRTAIEFRQQRRMGTAPERIYYHWKFGFPLSTMVLGFIGLTVGLHGYEKRAAGVGFCILFGFLYWTVFSVSIALGKTSHLGWGLAQYEPLVFVYGPPLVFLAATGYFWSRSRS